MIKNESRIFIQHYLKRIELKLVNNANHQKILIKFVT